MNISRRVMRILLMYDLPVITDREKKVYREFRKFLIKNGFQMMQYSIYVKIVANVDSANFVIDKIKRNLPDEGKIRVMKVTEKQYASMLVLLGGISKQEEKIGDNRYIEF